MAWVGVYKAIPPSSADATLSPCPSPASANGYSADRSSGVSSNSFAATSAATTDAADPPIPAASAIPLVRRSSKPMPPPSRSASASSARPALLRAGSSGMVEAPSHGEKIAILSDGRNAPFYGKEGAIIEGRYRILKIGVESVELAYADGRGRQTIRLTGS